MKIDKFDRHKSSIGYIAAKYTTIIMYILSVLVLFMPYVGVLAWLVAFIFFFKEKDSKMVRLHSAQHGFVLLIYSILSLILSVVADFIAKSASNSRSEVAIINAANLSSYFNTADRILQIIILVLAVANIILAYNYRFWNIPLLGKLAKRLHDRTKPGPLR